MTTVTTQNCILQITDALSGLKVPVRIDPEEASDTLGELLSKYLRHPPIERLLQERRLTQRGADTLQELQDLAHTMSDTGQLGELYAGLAVKQDGEAVGLESPPIVRMTRLDGREVAVVDVELDRLNVGYDRNWTGFHRRRWERDASTYLEFARRSVRRDRTEAEADDVLSLSNADQQVELVRSLARRVWESDFESYSRFTGGRLRYKTGDQTVRNIIGGGGGICSEKVQALKFLTDHFGIRSEYILAGPDVPAPVPEEKLRELLSTFDFRLAKRYLRYWQHTALLYTIGTSSILVDATNGNIPFLFVRGEGAERILGYEDKPPVTVRMAVYRDDFYYHRVSQDIAEDLFFAMEAWVSDIDLVQVFDNELGLYISPEMFVTPIVYKSQAAFERQREVYAAAAREAGMDWVASPRWTLESELGRRLRERSAEAAERIMEAEEHLVSRCDEQYGPGHRAGLTLIALGHDGDGIRQSR